MRAIGSASGCGQSRAAVGAGQHADQRDAELHRGQELVGIVRQRERRPGALVALLGALLQADLAGRHDGDLRHGEDAVGQDEEEDDEEFDTDTPLYERSGTEVQDGGSGRRFVPLDASKPPIGKQWPNLRREPPS